MRTKEDETEDAPLLPDQLCQHEEDKHSWRSAVLMLIRDHIEADETYRVCAADMEFGELLPVKPGSVEQADYEDRHRHAFQLEQLTKRVGELASRGLCAALMRDCETTDGYSVSRVDVEDGPEIIRIEMKE